ncbi:MAG: hypothetical protein GEV03_17675 [Streptosporangiales bacterium]|nr:hypothetical protein [Streptosporangiales bacterium]
MDTQRPGGDLAPSSTPPATHSDLLSRRLFAHLATVRPDGSPQSSVMWFEWDGEHLKFTHTRTRQRFRNPAAEPRVAISVADPDVRVILKVKPETFVAVEGGQVKN